MESTSVASITATSSGGKLQFTLNHYNRVLAGDFTCPGVLIGQQGQVKIK
jgi:hypothetical protein